jgi:hypothetical protein
MRHTFLLLLFFVLTLLSCAKEELEPTTYAIDFLPVKITVDGLQIPEIDKNTSRANIATDENTLKEYLIILFNENDTYLDLYPITSNKVEIPRATKKRTAYIIANAGSIITSADWAIGVTSITDIESSLTQSRVANTMPNSPFVMYAKLVFPNGINSNSAITSDGTHTGAPLPLKRNVSKVTISVASEIKNFTLSGLSLCNAPLQGYLLNDTPIENVGTDHYTLTDPSIPLFSFAATATTAVVLEATITTEETTEKRYFKIAIKDSQSQKAIGLKHNHHYNITITAKNNNGYSTLQQAIDSPIDNQLSSVLEIRDITMHDFIFNQNTFIATSNSDYTHYGGHIGTEYEICKVHFANNIEAEHAALGATSIQVINGAIEISERTKSSISAAQNHITYDVIAKFTKAETDATIELAYGALSMRITVKKRLQPIWTTDQFIEVPTATVGSIQDSSLSWCGITKAQTFESTKYVDINKDPSTGSILYLAIQKSENLTAPRSMEAFFTTQQQGMSKVVVNQE